ncbi:hypothetical protein FRC06_006900 [Ceratobasidium sp. 370]|nr:hypothetical protein FRC06_006900 [Ceratobasidium sp. 370]
MHNLAATYSKQGRLEESEQLALQVLSIRRRKLGDNHVDILDSMHQLAAAQQRDSLEEVEQHSMGTISPRERRLGVQPNRVLEALDLSSCPETALSGGRFGDVWRGSLLDRTQVAIKCLRLHTVDEVNSKAIKVRSIFGHYGNPRSPQQHAARELYFWSKLKHSNVLELLGFAMFQGQLAMISPWMENGTLNDHIRRHPELDRWALISEGLEYIHGVGMVHGDLKANNILVSAEGVVKLSDFGNSVMANHSLAFSATSIAGGGTARWMAPELIKREDGTTADRSMPADIYAFGMTILEVVTSRKPYSEYKREQGATLAAIGGKHPRRPSELSAVARPLDS